MEAEWAEVDRIGAAFLAMTKPEQARLQAAFIDYTNAFERRLAGRMTERESARNISFEVFLREGKLLCSRQYGNG